MNKPHSTPKFSLCSDLVWFFGEGSALVEPAGNAIPIASFPKLTRNRNAKPGDAEWVWPSEVLYVHASYGCAVDPDPNPGLLVRWGEISRALRRCLTVDQQILELAYGTKGRMATDCWMNPGRQWRAVAECTEAVQRWAAQWPAKADAPIRDPGPVEVRYMAHLDDQVDPRRTKQSTTDHERIRVIRQQALRLIAQSTEMFQAKLLEVRELAAQTRRESVRIALSRREVFPEDYLPGGRKHNPKADR